MQASRELLFPGPLAPSSHLGATLLRHVAVTGLRYALHQLGLPLPASAPVRIHRLRLYLDRAALAEELGSSTAGAEVAAALTDPGGITKTEPDRRLAGAALFHRARLLLGRRRPPRAEAAAPSGEASSSTVRAELSRLLPALNDAFLGELLAALRRRRDRGRQRNPPPCLGREAWRMRAGRGADLGRLGDPDPFMPSWAETAAIAREIAAALAATPLPARHRTRGAFREAYRAALDRLRPPLLALARDATGRGLLEDPTDMFFLPFDLLADLELPARPRWLDAAVAANRYEYDSLERLPGPPARLSGEETGAEIAPEAWLWAPLAPLP